MFVSRRHGRWVACVVAGLLVGACSGPGGLNHIIKPHSTPTDEAVAAPAEVVDTPKTRMLQVAWTSVRAGKCGFVLDQPKLKANFLASEGTRGSSPTDLQRLSNDYTTAQGLFAKRLAKKDDYCKPAAVEEIRGDVARYLAGDYAPRPVKSAAAPQGAKASSAFDSLTPQ